MRLVTIAAAARNCSGHDRCEYPGRKVMLDRPHRGEAHFIGISDLFQSLVKALFHGPGDIRILGGEFVEER
jgi:hypothetical protein